MRIINTLYLIPAVAGLPDFAKSSHGRRPSDGINPYVPKGEGDSRSPCPGLNVLANHNYLYEPTPDASIHCLPIKRHRANEVISGLGIMMGGISLAP
jgi:hypothetical protein